MGLCAQVFLTSSTTLITRLHLMDAPLSLDRGEITDKGAINHRAVLNQCGALVSALYAMAGEQPGRGRDLRAYFAAGLRNCHDESRI